MKVKPFEFECAVCKELVTPTINEAGLIEFSEGNLTFAGIDGETWNIILVAFCPRCLMETDCQVPVLKVIQGMPSEVQEKIFNGLLIMKDCHGMAH